MRKLTVMLIVSILLCLGCRVAKKTGKYHVRYSTYFLPSEVEDTIESEINFEKSRNNKAIGAFLQPACEFCSLTKGEFRNILGIAILYESDSTGLAPIVSDEMLYIRSSPLRIKIHNKYYPAVITGIDDWLTDSAKINEKYLPDWTHTFYFRPHVICFNIASKRIINIIQFGLPGYK